MKRHPVTMRLPGGAIVALHHGDHDQKSHGNRDGGGSDRPKRTIQQAEAHIDSLPAHGEGEDFAENPVSPASASDAQLMREAAARWGEGKNAWDEHAVEMEVPVTKITTNQPYIARVNAKSMVSDISTSSTLKPIHVFKYRGEYIVWDGNHRTTAYQIMGVKNIRARVLDLDRTARNTDIDTVSVNFKVARDHFLYVEPFEKSDMDDKMAKHHTPGGHEHDQKTHGNREGGSEEKSGGSGRSRESMRGRGPDRGVGGEEGKRIMAQPSSAYKVQKADGADTQQRYQTGKNQYAPDRAALHNEQMRQQFEGKTPLPEGRPTVYQIGGGSGAGKDRMIEDYKIGGGKNGDEHTVMSNADIYKPQYPEYGEKLKTEGIDAAAPYVHEESSYLAKETINDAVDGGFSVIANQTGNNTYESIEAKVAGYRRHGARVVAHYVTCDVDKAVERAIIRSKQPPDYRAVNESTIRQTHRSVSQIVPRAMAEGLFDELTLYDSNGDGGKAKIIAHYKDGKITIHDRGAWERFEAKGR